jgi:hypothetical protein
VTEAGIGDETEYWRDMLRKGDAGRLLLGNVLLKIRPVGELPRSYTLGVSSSSEIAGTPSMNACARLDSPGNTSSTGFLGARARCGEPRGLDERWVLEMYKCPAELIPGIDCARDMGGARALAEDLDLKWPREYGDVFRGR